MLFSTFETYRFLFSSSQFMVRVFRPDSTFSTLPVPVGVTASELTATMSRKYQVNVKSGHALYLREKGLGKYSSRSYSLVLEY